MALREFAAFDAVDFDEFWEAFDQAVIGRRTKVIAKLRRPRTLVWAAELELYIHDRWPEEDDWPEGTNE